MQSNLINNPQSNLMNNFTIHDISFNQKNYQKLLSNELPIIFLNNNDIKIDECLCCDICFSIENATIKIIVALNNINIEYDLCVPCLTTRFNYYLERNCHNCSKLSRLNFLSDGKICYILPCINCLERLINDKRKNYSINE